MTGPKYIVKFKGKRKHKTNYRKRLALVKSGLPRLVVRKSTSKITVQLIKYSKKGDTTIAYANSKDLIKYGWKVNLKNLPSSYLTGLLCGLKSVKKKIKKAILDTGLHPNIKNSRIYAALLGAIDAGLSISYDEKIFPKKERIKGKHIADYAAELKKSNLEKYKRLFSDYLKKKFKPEDIEKHFEEIKNKIVKEYGK